MNTEQEQVLRKICIKAKETRDNFVINCDVGVPLDKRNEICRWLERNGYISRYGVSGKSYVSCQVNAKAIEFFRGSQEEEL